MIFATSGINGLVATLLMRTRAFSTAAQLTIRPGIEKRTSRLKPWVHWRQWSRVHCQRRPRLSKTSDNFSYTWPQAASDQGLRSGERHM
jgi:hypothetical protein